MIDLNHPGLSAGHAALIGQVALSLPVQLGTTGLALQNTNLTKKLTLIKNANDAKAGLLGAKASIIGGGSLVGGYLLNKSLNSPESSFNYMGNIANFDATDLLGVPYAGLGSYWLGSSITKNNKYRRAGQTLKTAIKTQTNKSKSLSNLDEYGLPILGAGGLSVGYGLSQITNNQSTNS